MAGNNSDVGWRESEGFQRDGWWAHYVEHLLRWGDIREMDMLTV